MHKIESVAYALLVGIVKTISKVEILYQQTSLTVKNVQ